MGPLRLHDRDALAVIASVEGVGPIILERLLTALGGANGILEVARGRTGVDDLRAASRDPDRPGHTMTPSAAESLAVTARRSDVVLESMRQAGVSVLTLDDAGYPGRLRQIELPPRVLFVRGSMRSLEAGSSV
ncbi:MAG: hypothetical protein K2X91_12595, partial [Thermoleophilia bacterium]|nr:hypothetical protein [Thermoleophilia bacterium]